MAPLANSAPTCSVNENPHIEQGGGGRDSSENIERIYLDLISTLPIEKGWLEEKLYLYQGFWLLPSEFRGLDLRAILHVQQHFMARPSDLLLASYPKSGTTWLKSVLFAIVNRNTFNINHEDNTHPLLTNNPHDLVPFLENSLSGVGCSLPSSSRRLFATHIPYTLLPESVTGGGCRIVYVCRDPKDVYTSMFQFASKMRSKELPSLSLEKSLDLFCKGITPFGPSWNHVLEYHRASLTHPDRVLFVKYEEVQTNATVQVKRVAEFLGQPFSLEEERNGIVQGIVELCSFEKQRNLAVNKHGNTTIGIPKVLFYRTGKVGDSKNHLTTEMIERFDKIAREKFGDLL